MDKQKNFAKYLDTMVLAHESNEEMGLLELATAYANIVQVACRLEAEIRGAVGFGFYEDDPGPAVTKEVKDNALNIAARAARYHLGQFDYNTAVANGLEEEP